MHEAYVVVDRVGRLQVPKEYLTALAIKDKATMEFDGERIIIIAAQIIGGVNRMSRKCVRSAGKQFESIVIVLSLTC